MFKYTITSRLSPLFLRYCTLLRTSDHAPFLGWAALPVHQLWVCGQGGGGIFLQQAGTGMCRCLCQGRGTLIWLHVHLSSWHSPGTPPPPRAVLYYCSTTCSRAVDSAKDLEARLLCQRVSVSLSTLPLALSLSKHSAEARPPLSPPPPTLTRGPSPSPHPSSLPPPA